MRALEMIFPSAHAHVAAVSPIRIRVFSINQFHETASVIGPVVEYFAAVTNVSFNTNDASVIALRRWLSDRFIAKPANL